MLALSLVIACRQFGAKSLTEPLLTYCHLEPWEQTSVKLESKYKIFIYENVCENVVYGMAAMFARGDGFTLPKPTSTIDCGFVKYHLGVVFFEAVNKDYLAVLLTDYYVR